MDRSKESHARDPGSAHQASSWDEALALLREWDPAWAETCSRMTNNPWESGVLPRKTVELISVALNTGTVSFHPESARRHMRAALAAGASRDEILLVLKMSSLMCIHSCTLGGSILLEELPPSDLGEPHARPATPIADKLRAAGRWDPAWDAFFYLDPEWTEEVVATALGFQESGVIPPKLVGLLSVAYYASRGHLYPAETRRHIKAAMRAGARPEEVIEVLKLGFVQSVQASNFAVLILDEEVANLER
ncbi:MAG TPA: carboxymuconolactone decarboxylase family protein [Myxococcota bacterium]|nr:carboxymuconolactone decarboxylase family protein [Myxococcota bacterium]